MFIDRKVLKQLLEKAFEKGQSSCHDLREDCVQEIMDVDLPKITESKVNGYNDLVGYFNNFVPAESTPPPQKPVLAKYKF